MTLMQQPCAADFLAESAVQRLVCAPTAAPVRGTTVSAAARVRHTGADAFAFDVVVLDTAADAAPPPRGAPV